MIASKRVDGVDLDVVSLDIYGIVLGSPYLYDKKEVFFRHENKYHLTKDEVECIVISHRDKFSVSLVSAGQMNRLINSSKWFILMVVRAKDAETFEAFQGCDPTHKRNCMKLFLTIMGLLKNQVGCLQCMRSNLRFTCNRMILYPTLECIVC